jgi:hypothetical protein
MGYMTVKLERWSNLRLNVKVTGARGKVRRERSDRADALGRPVHRHVVPRGQRSAPASAAMQLAGTTKEHRGHGAEVVERSL